LVVSQDPIGRRTVTDRETRLARELTEIRVALGKVAAFEGIHETSTTAMMVDELVRDHEELEARIDAAIMSPTDKAMEDRIEEIARLLQGGTRVPDTPASLKEDE
jgi:hypothetical protein